MFLNQHYKNNCYFYLFEAYCLILEKVTVLLKKIKNLRVEKEITQYEMSAKLNMSQNSYYKLENGKTKLDILRLLQISNILEYNFTKYLKLDFETLES